MAAVSKAVRRLAEHPALELSDPPSWERIERDGVVTPLPLVQIVAVAGNAGVNLYGGSVLEEARGRGVYRALLRARWDFAVERSTPALTVQAGRMSKPIVERLGFIHLAAIRIFVDLLPN